ncbi:MAG: aspartate-semialdehyde dehydrogenase [Cellvibrionaceae bacterium]
MSCNLAIVGADSAVGEVFLQLIEEKRIGYQNLHVLSPDVQEQGRVALNGKSLRGETLADFDFSRVDVVFFVDDQALAAEYAGKAADAGAFVVDCSPHFRAADDVPLVVPEVNGHLLDTLERGTLIASPAPGSIFLALVLKPLMAVLRIRRVAVCSLQPVSNRGRRGVDELAGQTARLLNGMAASGEVFPKQMAFNILPQTSPLSSEGYSGEEIDLAAETKKLLDDPEFSLNPTCVQAPVFYSHSEVISVEADTPVSAGEVTTLLKRAPGLRLSRQGDAGPTAVHEATGADLVTVGRIRRSLDNDCEINLWCVGDNLRKGAALNAVQIAERLIKTHL